MNWIRVGFGGHRTVRLLHYVALLHSICQGILVVDVSLYLQSLGWNGLAIGGVLAISGVFRSLWTMFSGDLNQYLGAKRFIMSFHLLCSAAALVLSITANPVAICCATSLVGFGRGHSGSGGPTSPIERAWLRAYTRQRDAHATSVIFGMNAAMGYLGMCIGSLIAALPSGLKSWFPGAIAYHPVFVVVAALSFACSWLIHLASGGERKQRRSVQSASDHDGADVSGRRSENRGAWSNLLVVALIVIVVTVTTSHWNRWFPRAEMIGPLLPVLAALIVLAGKLSYRYAILAWHLYKGQSASHGDLSSGQQAHAPNPLVNLINSVAVALSSTMTSYWFSARFHANEALIGIVISFSYLATGVMTVVHTHLSNRLGPVKSLVVTQLFGALLVLALPFAPWFWLAAVLNAACMSLNLGSRGSRYLVVTARPRQPRSWQQRVTSILILTLTTGAWPVAFGHMLDEGEYILPFSIAASVQFLSALSLRKQR